MITAAILGVVQALTEFLPVSSSGHLRLAHALVGFEAPDDLLFDIVLHVGTLVAVIGVYRARIRTLLGSCVAGLRALPRGPALALREHEGLGYLVLITAATIPTGVIGVLLSDLVDSDRLTVPILGGLLVLNGVILWASRRYSATADAADLSGPGARRGPTVGGISLAQALVIGVVQGLAVLPGISRSGSTIVCALALGAGRMKAAEFSFFLSIPAILGAMVMEFDPELVSAAEGGVGVYAVGALSAAVVGVLALTLLLGAVRRARLHHFAWYCWALGVAAIAWGLL